MEKRMSETKTYIIGAVPHYRLGVYFEPGQEITVPASEQPSRTWFEKDGTPVSVKRVAGLDSDEQRYLSDEEKAWLAERRAQKLAEKASQKPAQEALKPKGRASDKEPI
jgi:hypothetical protein